MGDCSTLAGLHLEYSLDVRTSDPGPRDTAESRLPARSGTAGDPVASVSEGPPPGMGRALPRARLYASLRSWRRALVVAPTLAAMAAGIGQFGIITALAAVAKGFGTTFNGHSIQAVAGLSGSKLGIGLAVIRLASLGSLVFASLADSAGRRRVIIAVTVAGLLLTAIAGASPNYWFFVAVFALGRPFLSTTTAVATVMAAEESSKERRARAVGLVAAGYSIGAGIIAIANAALSRYIGFRGIFALSAVPLLFTPKLLKVLREPQRFESLTTVEHAGVGTGERAATGMGERAAASAARSSPVRVTEYVGEGAAEGVGSATAQRAGLASGQARLPGLRCFSRRHRSRMIVVIVWAFFLSFLTGPANTFVFLYAESFLHMAKSSAALLVLVAGVTGLAGLLAGRWVADRVGRRSGTAAAIVTMVACAILLYSGSKVGLVVGYEAGLFAAGGLAAPAGSLVEEQFPTSIRSSATGWYVAAGVVGAAVGILAFGVVAQQAHHFFQAALILFPVTALASLLVFLLPETRATEMEELWGE